MDFLKVVVYTLAWKRTKKDSLRTKKSIHVNGVTDEK